MTPLTAQLYPQLTVPGEELLRFFAPQANSSIFPPFLQRVVSMVMSRNFPWTDSSHQWKLGLGSVPLVPLHCLHVPPPFPCLLFSLSQAASAFRHLWQSLGAESWVWLEGLALFWQSLCPSLAHPGLLSVLPTFLLNDSGCVSWCPSPLRGFS